MGVIHFKEANCKNCYNCVRQCQVKSIEVKNEQARILDEGCILCGHCLTACTQNAKYIESDISYVEGLLRKSNKVYISLAPSFVMSFHKANVGQLYAAAKQLGFSGLEETAIGAGWVSAQYTKFAQEGKMKNIITTACPTIVSLVEKYYPQLVDCLAPVVSPMVAHAKMMREMYGERIKIVFVGPCIAKKKEAADSGIIDAVLSFDEFKQMIKSKGIDLRDVKPEGYEMHGVVNRLYPVVGGILATMDWSKISKYKQVTVDSLYHCQGVLEEMSKPEVSGFFIEMSACSGVCVGGPLQTTQQNNYLLGKFLVNENAHRKLTLPQPVTETVETDISTSYAPDQTHLRELPDEATIEMILAQSGKADPKLRLDCGACGYNNCHDKAIAVYQGKADINMCLPYMREKAESYSNFVMEHYPHAMFILDSELNILEYNPAAVKMFEMKDMDYHGSPIDMILDSDQFEEAREKENRTIERVVYFKHMNMTVNENLVYVPDHDYYMLKVKNITSQLEAEEKLQVRREEIVTTAQKIIDKQMRTAQEIASLLGETTGESKAVLTNLQKSIMADMKADIKEE